MTYKEFKQNQVERNKNLIKKLSSLKKSIEVKFDDYNIIVDPQTFNPAIGEGSLIMAKIKSLLKGNNVLDLGTGTGILALLAAKHSNNVVATDISPLAIECAKRNFLNHGFNNIDIRHGNLFEVVKKDEKFDVIIFNPPFLNGKPNEWIEYSYFDDDYKVLTNFFEEAKKYLTPNGHIFLCFSSAGDISYLNYLIETNKYKYDSLYSEILNKASFFVFKIYMNKINI